MNEKEIFETSKTVKEWHDKTVKEWYDKVVAQLEKSDVKLKPLLEKMNTDDDLSDIQIAYLYKVTPSRSKDIFKQRYAMLLMLDKLEPLLATPDAIINPILVIDNENLLNSMVEIQVLNFSTTKVEEKQQ